MLADYLRFKYPLAVPDKDYGLRDDGNGPFIEHWSDTLGPEPLADDIASAAADVDKFIAKNAILAQIDAIEQSTMVPRITREGLLKFAEMAAETEAEKLTASGAPTTVADLLSQNIGYQKTKAVDDQIRALRSQLK